MWPVGTMYQPAGAWIWIIIAKLHGDEEAVHYGHSDFTEAVNWLLNEDTEAADVMGPHGTTVTLPPSSRGNTYSVFCLRNSFHLHNKLQKALINNRKRNLSVTNDAI